MSIRVIRFWLDIFNSQNTYKFNYLEVLEDWGEIKIEKTN